MMCVPLDVRGVWIKVVNVGAGVGASVIGRHVLARAALVGLAERAVAIHLQHPLKGQMHRCDGSISSWTCRCAVTALLLHCRPAKVVASCCSTFARLGISPRLSAETKCKLRQSPC